MKVIYFLASFIIINIFITSLKIEADTNRRKKLLKFPLLSNKKTKSLQLLKITNSTGLEILSQKNLKKSLIDFDSQKISISGTGADGAITPRQITNLDSDLSISFKLGPGDFKLSKTIPIDHWAEVHSMIQLEDGRVAAAIKKGTIKIYDERDFTCTHELQDSNSETRPMIQLSDSRIVTGTQGKISIFDISQMKQSQVISTGKTNVRAILQIQNSNLLIGSEDGFLKILDVSTMTITKSIEMGSAVLSLAQMEDGKIIAGLENGGLKVLDTAYALIRTLKDTTNPISHLVVLKNGKLIAASNYMVKLLDMNSMTVLKTLETAITEVFALKLFNDGRLVMGSGYPKFRVWDPEEMKVIQIVEEAHKAPLCFCPLKDNRLISGDLDSINIWE